MKKTMILLMVGVLALALSSVAVLGAVPNGTTFTYVNDDTTFTATSAATVVANGGNITNFSASSQVQTNYWAAFYGDIVQQIFLADLGASSIVYDWGNQDLSGWLFFSNDSAVDWSGVVAGDATDASDEDTSLSLTGFADSVANTFVAGQHDAIADVGAAGIALDTAFVVNTTSSAAGSNNEWSTVLLRGGAAAADAAIYAGQVVQDAALYSGNLGDFQVILPVDAAGTRTYNVYAGIE